MTSRSGGVVSPVASSHSIRVRRHGGRYADDCRVVERLLVALVASGETVRMEPPRALLDVELRVTELARAHVVEPDVYV